jgi:thymidylate synthase
MAELIKGESLSSAWLRALEHLVAADHGKDVNLSVAFIGAAEDRAIRAALDEFIAEWRSQNRKSKIYPISTVANTLFPQALYRGEPGEETRARLYRLYERSMRVQRRLREKETYFNRFVNWPGEENINQLERVVARLQSQLAAADRKGPLSSAYDLASSAPDDLALDGDLRIYTPGVDNSPIGFPCLSQVSFTLVGRKIHLAALYRNQDFVSRAYGNYVGLARLGGFLSREVGCELGEVLCVASHADAGLSQYTKGRVEELLDRCQIAAAGEERALSRV